MFSCIFPATIQFRDTTVTMSKQTVQIVPIGDCNTLVRIRDLCPFTVEICGRCEASVFVQIDTARGDVGLGKYVWPCEMEARDIPVDMEEAVFVRGGSKYMHAVLYASEPLESWCGYFDRKLLKMHRRQERSWSGECMDPETLLAKAGRDEHIKVLNAERETLVARIAADKAALATLMAALTKLRSP